MATSGSAGDRKPTCFIAMPVATRPDDVDRYGDEQHWLHVMESLFVKAVEAAGFEAIRPVAHGSHLIHGSIIRNLSEADLVLCDLSSHNPNVFFELGVRTSLNLPIALVRDQLTSLPFDTSGINTHSYDSHLRGWEIQEEQARLKQHIEESVSSCAGENPLWRQFGLTIRAQEPDSQASPMEAKVDLLADRMLMLQAELRQVRAPDTRSLDEEALAYHVRSEHQLADVHRAPRGLLFESAARRYLDGLGIALKVTIRSADDVAVEIPDTDVPVDVLRRLGELADRYEVNLVIEHGTHTTLRAAAQNEALRRQHHQYERHRESVERDLAAKGRRAPETRKRPSS